MYLLLQLMDCMSKSGILLLFSLLVNQFFLHAQITDTTITDTEARRIITILASDSLKGRGNGQPGLLQAGEFIGEEFRKNKLHPLPGFHSYYIPFQPMNAQPATTESLIWNGNPVPAEHFMYLQARPGPYSTVYLHDFYPVWLDTCFAGELTDEMPARLADAGKNLLIWTNKRQPDGVNIFPPSFQPLPAGARMNILLVYVERPPDSIRLEALPAYASMEYNITGILPGKSKAKEVILFSAHYDHMGVLAGRKKDSIMNGANDNASGTTALLLLARYFALRNDNERTLLFCAFAGEELGLKGSTDFARYINGDNIIAGINLEMLGVPQYGKKRVFITGERYSSLPDLLQKGLRRHGLRLVKEPDESKRLFMRSDNYAFVAKGVPAHTIMASDDDDGCYHRVCDEIKRIDISNMTAIVRAIAAAVAGLVSGQETPGRIDPSLIRW